MKNSKLNNSKKEAEQEISHWESLNQEETANTAASEQVLIYPAVEETNWRVPVNQPGRHLRAAEAAAQQITANQQIIGAPSQQDQSKKPITADEVGLFLGLNPETDPITDQFESPYTDLELWRFHDIYRRDGTARRAINILSDFVLGTRTKTTLDTTKEYPTNQETDDAISQIQSNKQYQGYKSQIDKINRDVNFHYWTVAAFAQMLIFGRAAIAIQDDPITGLPIALKLFSSMQLGRIFVNQRTFEIVAIEHLGYNGLESIIPADKVIYWTDQNYQVSPNTYGFGLSALEVVMDISETNRIARQMDLKEIAKSLWAPYIVGRLDTRKASVMKKVAAGLKPGLPFIHNQNLNLSVYPFQHDMDKLVNMIETNDRTICRMIGVPLFLVGFEDFPNRATASTGIDTWTKSALAAHRTRVRDIIEDQWIDRILSKITSMDKTVLSQQEWKIKLDFDTITEDNFAQVAAGVELMVNANVIDTEKARELIGCSDIDERMAAEEKIQQQEQEKQLQELQKQQAQQNRLVQLYGQHQFVKAQAQQQQSQTQKPTQKQKGRTNKTGARSLIKGATISSQASLDDESENESESESESESENLKTEIYRILKEKAQALRT